MNTQTLNDVLTLASKHGPATIKRYGAHGITVSFADGFKMVEVGV